MGLPRLTLRQIRRRQVLIVQFAKYVSSFEMQFLIRYYILRFVSFYCIIIYLHMEREGEREMRKREVARAVLVRDERSESNPSHPFVSLPLYLLPLYILFSLFLFSSFLTSTHCPLLAPGIQFEIKQAYSHSPSISIYIQEHLF